MADKTWDLVFTLNELPAAHAQQVICGIEAANLGLAVNRGFTEIKKRPNVKGRRIRSGRLTFTVRDEAGDDE
jgi:hypothetical protein